MSHIEWKTYEEKKGCRTCYSSLYFYYWGQMIGWKSLGIFLKFYYTRISINTLLCNPNLRYSESLIPYSYRRRQIGRTMLNLCVFF